LYVNQDTVASSLGGGASNSYYVRLVPGQNAETTAKGIEAALFTRAPSDLSPGEMNDAMALSRGSSTDAGFMGLDWLWDCGWVSSPSAPSSSGGSRSACCGR